MNSIYHDSINQEYCNLVISAYNNFIRLKNKGFENKNLTINDVFFVRNKNSIDVINKKYADIKQNENCELLSEHYLNNIIRLGMNNIKYFKSPIRKFIKELNHSQNVIKIVSLYDHSVKQPIQDLTQAVQAMFKHYPLWQDQLDCIIPLLSFHVKTPKLLFLAHPETKEEFLQEFELIVLTAIQCVSEKEFLHYEKILESIQSEMRCNKASGPILFSTVQLHHLAMVFGDSFLNNTSFEGDVNSAPYLDFLMDYLERRPIKTMKSKRLFYLIKNRLDLASVITPSQLLEKIKSALDHCPPGTNGEVNCLLYGGWVDHAVGFEIERKFDGKYLFRVFNSGKGVVNHVHIELPYKRKYSCAYTIDNEIEEDVLLDPAFLANFISLTKQKEGQDFLYKQILPILGSPKEISDPDLLLNFKDSQRSGTCVFGWISVFLAQFLTKSDNQRLRVEFGLYLLKSYYPTAKLTMKNTKICNQIQYQQLTLEYNTLTKIIQEFSDEVQKKQKMSHETRKEIRKQMLRYSALLKSMEKTMFAYESQSVSLQKSVVPLKLPSLPLVKIDFDPINCQVQPTSMPPKVKKVLDLIPQHSHSDVRVISRVINELNHIQIETSEINVILNQFFQWIGPLEDFEKIHFGSPKEIRELIENIDCLLKKMELQNKMKLKNVWREVFTIGFYYLSECAYNQLPTQEKISNREYLSFLSSIPPLSTFEVGLIQEPYWVNVMHQLTELKEKRKKDARFKEYRVPNFDHYCEPLASDMAQLIWNYWISLPQEFHDQVKLSIAEERDFQKGEIKIKENEILDSISKLQNSIEKWTVSLENKKKMNGKQINSIEELFIKDEKYKISQLELKRSNLQTDIENDSKYWPKGWEDEQSKELSEHDKATYILSNHQMIADKLKLKTSLFPSPFQAFFLTATRASCSTKESLFERNNQEIDYSLKYHKEKGEPAKLYVGPNYLSHFSKEFQDLLQKAYPSENWQKLDKLIFKEWETSNFSESSVPKVAEDFLKENKETTLSSEELREVLAWGSKEIRLESILDYFEENREKLEDSNWMLLLYSLLYRSQTLLLALSDPDQRQKSIQRLENFFSKLKLYALSKGNFSFLGNLMMIKGLFISCLIHSSTNRQERDRLSNLDEIREILHIGLKEEFKTEWPALFEGLTAYCAQVCFINGIESKDPCLPLLLNLFRRYHSAPASSFPLRSTIALPIEFKILNYFRTLEEHTPLLFNEESYQILERVFPQLGLVKQVPGNGDILETADKRTRILLSSGTLYSDDSSLFKTFSMKPDLQLHEQLENFALFSKEELEGLLCHDNGIYTYIKNPKTQLSLIYNKVKKTFFVEIETSPGKKELCQIFSGQKLLRQFNDQYAFVATKFCYYFCEKKTFQIKYVIKNGEVTEKSSRLKLLSSTLFENFELSDFTLFWGGSDPLHPLKKIEFPRMNLSFVLEERQNEPDRFKCLQHPDFFISLEQFAPHFGSTTGFLTLENDQGEKKILLPLLPANSFVQMGASNQALKFPFRYDYKVQNKTIRTVEYELKDNHLIPKSLEARYQLAYIYLEKGFTHLADRLLFSHQAEINYRKLSKEEREILEKITLTEGVSKEKSNQKISCQMRGLYLLEKDNLNYEKSARAGLNSNSQENEIFKTTLYESYLSRLNQVKTLEEREEKFLLNHLKLTPALKIRMMELEGKLSEVISCPIVHKETYKQIFANFNPLRQEKEEKPAENFLPLQVYYQIQREKHSFPFCFDKMQLLEREFNDFYPCIYKEIQSLKTLSEARINGMMSLLSLASLEFPHNQNVKTLMTMIDKLDRSQINDNIPQRFHLSKTSSKRSWKSQIESGIQHLDVLKMFPQQPDEISSFLSSICDVYIEERPLFLQKVQSPLFSDNAPEIGDGVTSKHFKMMREDLDVAEKLSMEDKGYQEVDGMSLVDLELWIGHRLKDEAEKLASQESRLLKAVHTALTTKSESNLQYTSGKRRLPAIQELAILCAKMDNGYAMRKLYPELSQRAVNNLRLAIRDYLIHFQSMQHLKRSLNKTKEVQIAEGMTRELLLNELGQLLKTKRNYQIEDELALPFLMIETISNITLRKNQTKNIESFYQSRKDGKELFIQMIMGAGKTSVIQRTLSFLFAKPDSLSTVTVPEPLFPSVQHDLSKMLGNAFDLLSFSVPFTRELAQDADYIHNYYELLKEAKNRGAVVLFTPEQKYAIYSSLKEAYFTDNERRTEDLAAICQLLGIFERAQFDEINAIMDPTVIHKFPVGSKMQLDEKRAFIVTDLVLALVNDKTISSQFSIDFIDRFKKRCNPNYRHQGKELTGLDYERSIVPELVLIAEKLFLNKISHSQELNVETRKAIHDFLSQSRLNVKERNELIAKSLSHEQREILGALAKSIHIVLKKSLFEQVGVHFSTDPLVGVYTARTYDAPFSPKRSVPCDPYEMLIKSIQMSFYHGVPRHAVEKLLNQWQMEAVKEIEENKPLSSISSYQKYKKIMGSKADDFSFFQEPPKPEFIDDLMKRVNADDKLIETFIKEDLIKQVGFYPQSIETTPHTLAGLSAQKFGYSATYNKGVLSRSMVTQPEAGTDGKTTIAVANKISRGSSQIREMEASPLSYLDQVLDSFEVNPDLYVFIDSGNWLKDEAIEDWSVKLLEGVMNKDQRNNIKGVVYPNRKGEWLSLERQNVKWISIPLEQSTLSVDERLTIIPSKHEIGTNIPQNPTAKAFLSIRKGMKLSDMLQSVFRMRQILLGQQVIIGISKEVKDHIASELLNEVLRKEPYQSHLKGDDARALPIETEFDLWVKKLFDVSNPLTQENILTIGCESFTLIQHQEHLWNYLLKNQINDWLFKNYLSLNHQFHEVLDKPIRWVLLNTNLPYDRRKQLHQVMGEFFVPNQEDSPFEEMTKNNDPVAIEEAIQLKISRLMQDYSRLDPYPDLKSWVDAYIFALYFDGKGQEDPKVLLKNQFNQCIDKDILPEFVQIPHVENGEIDQQLHMDQKEQVEMQEDINMNLAIETIEDTFYTYEYCNISTPNPKPYSSYESLSRTYHFNSDIHHSSFIGLNNGGLTPPTYSQKRKKTEPIVSYDPFELMATTFPLIKNNLYVLPPAWQELLEQQPLYYSPNMFLEGNILSSHYLPGRYLLAMKDPQEKCRYVLVSHEDAAYIKKGMKLKREQGESNPESSLALFTFSGEISSSFGPQVDWRHYQIEKAIVLGKLITGKTNFCEDEIEILQGMIQKSKDPKATLLSLKNLFERMISIRPSSAKRYNRTHNLTRNYFRKNSSISKVMTFSETQKMFDNVRNKGIQGRFSQSQPSQGLTILPFPKKKFELIGISRSYLRGSDIDHSLCLIDPINSQRSRLPGLVYNMHNNPNPFNIERKIAIGSNSVLDISFGLASPSSNKGTSKVDNQLMRLINKIKTKTLEQDQEFANLCFKQPMGRPIPQSALINLQQACIPPSIEPNIGATAEYVVDRLRGFIVDKDGLEMKEQEIVTEVEKEQEQELETWV